MAETDLAVPIANDIPRRARIREIANLAGVGTATVDRVLNDRPNVSAQTRQRVQQAKAVIETGGAQIARRDPWRIKVLLPDDPGSCTEYLASCLQDVGVGENAIVECVFAKKMEPAALARKLRACIGQRIHAIAFQALEDPRVNDAVADLAAAGISCVTLLSGIDNSETIGFVGVDNRAAGRTAGHMMGRFLRQPGSVAILSGGQLYRCNEDREMGFRATLRSGFTHLKLAGTFCGDDNAAGNYRETQALLEQVPDLVGIYNVGGGNEGVVRALEAAGVAGEITLIAHNLTPTTRGYLLDGSVDIVLHQNMRRAAQLSIGTLVAHLEQRRFQPEKMPVEIITRENIQGVMFG